MKVYNKLVRDLIPEVIKADGNECEIEIATKEREENLVNVVDLRRVLYLKRFIREGRNK